MVLSVPLATEDLLFDLLVCVLFFRYNISMLIGSSSEVVNFSSQEVSVIIFLIIWKRETVLKIRLISRNRDGKVLVDSVSSPTFCYQVYLLLFFFLTQPYSCIEETWLPTSLAIKHVLR